MGRNKIDMTDLIATDANTKFGPATRMAVAIIETIREQGGCLPQDLNAKGFTPAEVDQHWHMAKSLANVEMKLAGESDAKQKSICERK